MTYAAAADNAPMNLTAITKVCLLAVVAAVIAITTTIIVVAIVVIIILITANRMQPQLRLN